MANEDEYKKEINRKDNEIYKLLNEIDKFKNHILLLTENNKELMDELDNVNLIDDKIRELIDKDYK
jgi:ABC-type Mn2+/Zn2+ transport system ATPase subunit